MISTLTMSTILGTVIPKKPDEEIWTQPRQACWRGTGPDRFVGDNCSKRHLPSAYLPSSYTDTREELTEILRMPLAIRKVLPATRSLIAEALGLGHCQIAPVTDRNRTNTRPCEKLSAMFPPRKNRVSRWALSYHITWVAMFGLPPAEPGLSYSHRCHEPCCVNPKHGVWEPMRKNHARNTCRDGRSHMLLDNGEEGRHLITNCPHDPPCVSGTAVRGMEHSSIIRLD
ncbi:hypothetical protein F4818DRAFT_26682 [Hypoxylon cercidicola]|nr:hypothetical protein F4818DRAFT_26682 [Hypoxylon cercidicola]